MPGPTLAVIITGIGPIGQCLDWKVDRWLRAQMHSLSWVHPQYDARSEEYSVLDRP